MSAYFFYKNDSHLFVVEKPIRPSPTTEDEVNEYLGQLHLRLTKVRPLLVNCTVAPLAAECRSAKKESSGLDRWVQQWIQQHAGRLLLSLLLIVIFVAIVLVTIRTILRTVRKYKSRSSTIGYEYYTDSVDSSVAYYEAASEMA